ncbi:MAG: FAD-dependent oxidoreductase [Syntrophobacterales bacterium]|jgi:nitrite reductase (NADH) large subunit
MRHVIIGNGAAGNAAAVAIRHQDPAPELLILSDEPQSAYYRPLITNLLAGGPATDISFSESQGALLPGECRLGARVAALDAASQTITLENGEEYGYDRLLLATGAAALVPDIPGWTGSGTFVMRTLADAEIVARAAATAKTALILGAGRVGLKAAMALQQRGLEVTVVEQDPHLAPMQFDQEASDILEKALSDLGLRLIFQQTVTEVRRAGERLTGAVLADGRVLEAELMVAAVGVRPKVELARQAGLAVNEGIIVDSRLCTSASEVYAAGDVVETTDIVTGHRMVSGLWTNAVEMGRLAGSNMAGAALEYPGAIAVLNSLEVAGIPTVAVGLTQPPPDPGYQVYQSHRGSDYRKLVCRDNVLMGALLVGDLEGAGVYTGLIRTKAPLDQPWDLLAEPRRMVATRFSRRTAPAT